METYRYISQSTQNNPIQYLDDFFSNEVQIEDWLADIESWIHAGIYSPMVDLPHLEFGFLYCRLIQQLEVAHVITQQCLLHSPPSDRILPLPPIVPLLRDEVRIRKFASADTLSKFFTYQDLNGWYRTFDLLLTGIGAHPASQQGDRFGDHSVLIQHLIMLMNISLYNIYLNKGLKCAVPSYLIPEPAPTKAQQPLLLYKFTIDPHGSKAINHKQQVVIRFG